MQSLGIYDRFTSITLPDVIGLTLLAIPSYIIFNECVKPKLGRVAEKVHNKTTHAVSNEEEDILESKIRSDAVRPGPAFLNSHDYHTRRVERCKAAYNTAWSDVNSNLDVGNRQFVISFTENDENILNVVKRLLKDELSIDGYTASIEINQCSTPFSDIVSTSSSSSSSDEQTPQPAYTFSIIIE
jgi:hypothetical protein